MAESAASASAPAVPAPAAAPVEERFSEAVSGKLRSGHAAGFIHKLRDLPVLAETAPLASLVAELRAGRYSTKDGHVHLREGLKWTSATNNVLFVRKIYPHLFEKVLGECKRAAPQPGKSAYDQEKAQRCIITGQPGIGKSLFGWYIIFRVLTEQPGRTIVYSSLHDRDIYIIPPQGPVRSASNRRFFLEDLECIQDLGSDVLVIADSLLPPVLPYPTVVISSPGRLRRRGLRDTLNNYRKPQLYMPIPSEAEVLELYALAFSFLPKEDVLRRMALWGPIPRNVLAEVDGGAQDEEIERSELVPLDTLAALARGQAIAEEGAGLKGVEDAPHRILHERAAGQDAEPGTPEADPNSTAYYRRGNVVIASLPFVRHVIGRLMKEQEWNAAFLVDISAGIGALGALRGIKFEEVVLALLESGAELKARNLSDGKDLANKIVFPAAKRIGWNKPAELEVHRSTANTLLVPDNRNEAGLDALVWAEGAQHHEPLDSTVWIGQGLHVRGLSEALAGLGWTPTGGWPQSASTSRTNMTIRYFWAVPEERFNEGWRSSQTRQDTDDVKPDAAAAAVESESADVFKAVVQYALCIPRNFALGRIDRLCHGAGAKLPYEYKNAGRVLASPPTTTAPAAVPPQSRRLFSTMVPTMVPTLSVHPRTKLVMAAALPALAAVAFYGRNFR